MSDPSGTVTIEGRKLSRLTAPHCLLPFPSPFCLSSPKVKLKEPLEPSRIEQIVLSLCQ